MVDLKRHLKNRFGYDSFKMGQEETIRSLLAGKNTLTILPTGTGKSLCYQLPGYLFEGSVLIISPLISLMEDQVMQLKKMGEKAVVALNSTLDFSSKNYALNHLSMFKFIFISPEMLNQKDILNRIKQLDIALLVIDEAHCVSEWGHDFRPSYLLLEKNIKELNKPLTLALTATATKQVKEDIKHYLFDNVSCEEFCYTIDRPNIYYDVVVCEDKIRFLIDFLKEKNSPGIIYFSSKKEAKMVSDQLNENLPYKIACYHGDLSNSDRIKIQQQFIHDDIRVLCATNAFGMGVDKQNIRFVLHYHLPDSLENYVQESGRAGRDGKQSISTILYKKGDEKIHHYLQKTSYHQKKELLVLKNKNLNEIKMYYSSLNDTQKKWLNQLQETDWDWATFEKGLELKKLEKTNKTSIMLAYIHTNTCKREFILSYFDNEFPVRNKENCCQYCSEKAVELEEIVPIESHPNELFDADSLLKKLFLRKS